MSLSHIPQLGLPRWRLARFAATLAFVVNCGVTRADIVTDWNQRAVTAMAAAGIGGGIGPSRILAIMHIAMVDGLNASAQRNAADALPEVAVHAAARRVLAEIYPAQKAGFDAAFDSAMAKVADGSAKTNAMASGESAAMAIVAERKTDRFSAPDTYRPVTAPGSYITTAQPVFSHAAGMKPFAIVSAEQFRPGPPPALDSALWARDYNETKDLGGASSTKRTAWQTETARFWEGSGAFAWNQAARSLANDKPLPLPDSARLFMLLNVATFDAYVANLAAKYHYGFWRPVTAIRNGDRDGNDATERDAAWLSAAVTPFHPEYPCAHCVNDGAAGAVLKSVFGSGSVPEFTVTFAAMPSVKHSYTSIRQLEDEVAMARIWGGMHYRNSNEVGQEQGRLVGDYVLKNFLRPAR